MQNQPDDRRCGTCRYSHPIPGDQRYECRRRAPSALTGSLNRNDIAFGWFPVMSAREWCGEWAPENPETLPEGAPILIALALAGDLGAARALADKLRE